MLKASLPNPVGRILGKLNGHYLKQRTEARFLSSVAASDAVYIWGRVPPDFICALKDRGALIFQEKINGLNAASREILDGVYKRLGKRPAHRITEDHIERDLTQLSLVDYVFVANPVAADQYGRFGVDTRKIIRSSYGWEQSRFSGSDIHRTGRKFTAAFVGVADIHKGADLLLRAWAQSGIEGRLVFGGPVSKALAEDCADLLARPDVVVTGWTDDVEKVYRSADVFVFPSHDEGGPLVTYEAMGCGLPVVVSPVGAGAIARDGLDGYVIDPFDLDGWIDALRRLAADPELRRSMGTAARQRAQDFTWCTRSNSPIPLLTPTICCATSVALAVS